MPPPLSTATGREGPAPLPGQDSGAGSGGICGGARPMGLRARELALLLVAGRVGWRAHQDSAGELTRVVTMEESWWAGQPSYHPGPEPGP